MAKPAASAVSVFDSREEGSPPHEEEQGSPHDSKEKQVSPHNEEEGDLQATTPRVRTGYDTATPTGYDTKSALDAAPGSEPASRADSVS